MNTRQTFRRYARKWYGAALTIPLCAALAQMTAQPASASATVNVTFHIPMTVAYNTCSGDDPVNLNGDMHIVITTTQDRQGGYRVTNHRNTHLVGNSIVTGLKYINNETSNDQWYAAAPLPATQRQTYNSVLVSQGSTPNMVLHTTIRQTVDAAGNAATVAEDYAVDCRG